MIDFNWSHCESLGFIDKTASQCFSASSNRLRELKKRHLFPSIVHNAHVLVDGIFEISILLITSNALWYCFFSCRMRDLSLNHSYILTPNATF